MASKVPTKNPPQAGAPPSKGGASSNKAANTARPQQAKAGKAKSPPKKAEVATAPVKQAHHGTLSPTVCLDCAVGVLKKSVTTSMRTQRSIDPPQAPFLLSEEEEIEFPRTDVLDLQLVGLRGEHSVSNRFDDLMVVLYQPAALKEGEKSLLLGDDVKNAKDAQTFIDEVLGSEDAPKGWPFPGRDVSCKECGHWRVLTFPITTEPGYDKDRPGRKAGTDFGDQSQLPAHSRAILPGIYNQHYRVGLHLGARKPPDSYAALQLMEGMPSRSRKSLRFPFTAAREARNSAEPRAFRSLVAKDKTQKEARKKFEEELAETLPNKTAREKRAFATRVQEELDKANTEKFKDAVAEAGKKAATGVLEDYAKAFNQAARKPRPLLLEGSDGREKGRFETEGSKVVRMEVIDDATGSSGVGLQLVLQTPPAPKPAPPPAGAAPAPEAAAAAPVAPPPVKLAENDVLVYREDGAGFNIHRSQAGVGGAYGGARQVNNWSEGCQVFRAPDEFKSFLRMAMLAKRARCGSRNEACGKPLTREDVEAAEGGATLNFLRTLPAKWADSAKAKLAEVLAAQPDNTPRAADVETHIATLQGYERLDMNVELDFVYALEQWTGKSLSNATRRAYVTETNLTALGEYCRNAICHALTPRSTQQDFEIVGFQVLGRISLRVGEALKQWAEEQKKLIINQLHPSYVKDKLEPCDFGACRWRFDYMLAALPRSEMQAFVSKLGDRSWESLFPHEAAPVAAAGKSPAPDDDDDAADDE
ncbi:MAG TPA: hypothetical protein VE153_41035 [Myxococcus sp.]|nr:hypothetical protein [Myxococcus sp.]